ncbi:DUF2244 domain-containing protein [Marinobacter sediminum]|uniref:DUF2244 domain-containing protein n=1 Tax=Marinobacter sediminum TaxID=256323 RepID=UPI0035649E03
MALHKQQARDGTWRYELCPNRSRSWPETQRFFAVMVVLGGSIALLFAAQGLWWVAPFSGLELLALGAGLYFCSRATYQRELILVREAQVSVLRGGAHQRSQVDFTRAWAQLRWRAAANGGGRSQLLLGSHGRYIEIGAFLVDAERRQLAGELGLLLGQPSCAESPVLPLNTGLNREIGL